MVNLPEHYQEQMRSYIVNEQDHIYTYKIPIEIPTNDDFNNPEIEVIGYFEGSIYNEDGPPVIQEGDLDDFKVNLNQELSQRDIAVVSYWLEIMTGMRFNIYDPFENITFKTDGTVN